MSRLCFYLVSPLLKGDFRERLVAQREGSQAGEGVRGQDREGRQGLRSEAGRPLLRWAQGVTGR